MILIWPHKVAVLIAALLCLPAQAKPLSSRSFQEIIAGYSFVGDFSQKPPTRDNSKEVFWRYPLKIDRPDFEIHARVSDFDKEFPKTSGTGRAYQHMNRARILFREGLYKEARSTLLSARARFGNNFPHHRRNDYFLALSFMNMSKSFHEQKGNTLFTDEVKSNYDNAATFLSYAYQIKRDIPDPVVDGMAGKHFYNLAAIYFTYGRYAAAYGAALQGLNYGRATGDHSFHAGLRRIRSEAFIQNRSYLEAVQELDTALRQKITPAEASAIFARVADIYFDLNNFELAEDVYALAMRVDQEMEQIKPSQLVLRGESLFWMGKFSDAQKMFHYALEKEVQADKERNLSRNYSEIASMRIADSYMALGKHKEASLQYYRHIREYRHGITLPYAKMRLACLDMPHYDGKNVEHARAELVKLKAEVLVPAAREMAWACEVSSYTERERTNEMIERVRAFYQQYPNSELLKDIVEPIREVQARAIDEYFKSGDIYSATLLYEKKKDTLYKDPDDDLKEKLFVAYIDSNQSHKAEPFWVAFKDNGSDLSKIRKATFLSEISSLAIESAEKWKAPNKALAEELDTRDWKIGPSYKNRRYLERIMSSEEGYVHLPWIYRVTYSWIGTDKRLICDLSYPVLSRLNSAKNRLDLPKDWIVSKGEELIDKHLGTVEELNPICSVSMMEFEMNLLEDSPVKLAERYIKRTNRTISFGVAPLYWSLAERLHAEGNREHARKLWSILVEKAPPNSLEVKFAAARLKPVQTEFDNLWQ